MEEDEAKPAANTQAEDDGAATAANDRSARASAPPSPAVPRSGAIVSLATKKPRRATKRGWGPFQSVVKERSADFNLTLDVNNLRQEIQHLTNVRDLQRSKVLIQRHSPEGSLAKMVHEYFRVFHHGSLPSSSSPVERRHSTGSKRDSATRTHRSTSTATATARSSRDRNRPSSDLSQRQLLHRMMDERVDFGGDSRGPDALADVIKRLSGSLRILGLSLETLEVTAADETVIVATRARLRFRVIRETIEEQFPHIRAHRRLVSSLMGREIEAGGRLLFYFDEHDKCVQLLSDVDFVGAFGAVLAEPSDLAMLLDAGFFETSGRDGSPRWDSVYVSPRRLAVQEHGPRVNGQERRDFSHHHDGTPAYPDHHQHPYQSGHHSISRYSRAVPHWDERRDSADTSYAPPALPFPRLARSVSSHQLRAATAGIVAAEFDVIDGYFSCFESAFALFDPELPDHHDRIDLVRAFMARSFTPDMRYGHHLAGWSALERRWTALDDSFELHAFRPDGPPRDITSEYGGGTYRHHVVVVRAVYSLHITMRTLARVFPRLLPPRNAPIQRHLLGQTLAVPAQLTFSLDPTFRIARVDECVDFASAMCALLRPLEMVDPSALLADARLVENGLEDEMQGHSHAMLATGRIRSSSEPTTGSDWRQRHRQAPMSFSDLLNDRETP